MGTVLIAGAGYVGIRVGLALVRAGHDVFGLRRNVALLPPEIRPLRGDLGDPGSLATLPESIDQVIYAAAADGTERDAYQLAYVDGLSRVIDAVCAGRRSPRRIVFTSSTAVYAQQEGEWVDESSPTEPGHFTGQLMLEAEARLRAASTSGVVLRLGGIYGPGRTRLIEQVRSGQVSFSGSGGHVNRVHRDDCAGAIRHVLDLAEPEPLYLVVDDEPAPQEDVVLFIAARLGLPLPQPAAVPAPAAAGRRGRRTNKRCSNARLKRSGYQLAWPTYREGYAALL